jgi:predicted nuclease with TOPRIM domain
LMKNSSKRKRTRDELEEVKQEEEALKEDRHQFLQEVKRLKQEHAEMMEALQAAAMQQHIRDDENEDRQADQPIGGFII